MEPSGSDTTTTNISFGEAVKVWLRVALLSFGGPAGQIAVMHRILVEEKKWITEDRFLHALNYCMLLPGPEAQQLATYVGWLLHRVRGGLTAGLLFVLPGFISILALSILYADYRDLTVVQGLFYGLKPAVVAIVIDALFRIGRRSLKNGVMASIAALAFIGIFVFQVPFPLIVLSAAVIGYLGGRWRPDLFVIIKGHKTSPTSAPGNAAAPDEPATTVKPMFWKTTCTLALWLTIWLAPVAALWTVLGGESVYTKEAVFFSKTAIVTFGGAYAVLAYIAQEGVSTYHWLGPGEMLDGLGMAETTPGPLIQVVQFVGFMGAYRSPGDLSPVLAGVAGSIVTTWVTFAPCFLWIFTGAPYIEYLRGRQSLNAALSAVTAAVVGVVLNLSLWFALHTMFGAITERQLFGARLLVPDWSTFDPVATAISAAALIAMFRLKAGMLWTLLVSAMVGLAYYTIAKS